jgi:hypothetical protein
MSTLARLVPALVAAALTLAACETTYDFEPTTVGEGDDTDRALRSRTSSQFVRGLYADLLARAPARYEQEIIVGAGQAFRRPVDEERDLVGVLDGVADPAPLRALIIRGVLENPDVALPDKGVVPDPAAFIRDRFRRYLGREPNTYELAAFVDAWRTDAAVGPRTVVRALLGSREYQSR